MVLRVHGSRFGWAFVVWGEGLVTWGCAYVFAGGLGRVVVGSSVAVGDWRCRCLGHWSCGERMEDGWPVGAMGVLIDAALAD